MSADNNDDENDSSGVLSPRVNDSPPVHRLNVGAGLVPETKRHELGSVGDLRESLWMSTYGGDRNLFDALGYVKEPRYEHFRARYERTDTAPALVDKLPQKAWAKPEIIDTGAGEETSDFEDVVESFLSGEYTPEDPIEVFERASRMERLGEFSLIFLGLADDAVAEGGADDLEEEVDADSLEEMDPDDALRYLTPYDQGRVDPDEIDWVDDDPTDPRFGKPRSYQVDLGDNRPTVQVHHSRVIHVVGNVFDDELKSDSVLKQSLNRIDDIEKILGASAEGYWRSAYQGLVISPPERNGQQAEFKDDGEGLHKQIRRYIQNMSREIFTGADIDTIESSTEDPTGHLEGQYRDISAGHDIPQSILMGNETGERATSEDRAMWHERAAEFRREYCAPVELRPTLDRLINLNVFPEPEGEYRVEWPALEEQSEQDQADVAQTLANAVNTGTGGNPLQAMTVEEFRQKILGWKPKRGAEADDAVDGMEPADAGDLDVDEENERVQEQFQQLANRENAEYAPSTFATDGDPGEFEDFQKFLDGLVEAGADVWQIRNGELRVWPDDWSDFALHDPVINVMGISDQEALEIYEEHDVQFLFTPDPEPEDDVDEATRRNANRYSQGDPVSTPQGVGVVIEVMTSPDEEAEIEASESSPTYAVAVEDGRVGVEFYKASEIHSTELNTPVDNPAADIQEEATRSNSIEEYIQRAIARFRGNADGRFSWPDAWQEADAPARLIALDAWSSMGGDVESCISEMRGSIADPGRFCADFADRLYGTDYWRGDSWAPED